LKGSKYHSKAKAWSCSLSPSNIAKLREWEFEIDPKLNSYLEKYKPEEIKRTLKIKGLGGVPYQFQWEGIQFVEEKNGRALIADEMGLGKTIQALSWLQLHPEHRPAIVICTATAKYQWKREAEIWLSNPNAQVISNQDSIYADLAGLYIINYDILKSWTQDLRKLKPKALIIDECFPAGTKITTPHRTKNIENLKVGDVVKNATGIGFVEKINKRKTTHLIRVHLENGQMITTTPNHPFFTERGWICASELKGHIVFDHEAIFNIFTQDSISKTNNNGRKKMRMVWNSVRNHIPQKTFLQQILFSEMEEYIAINKEGIAIRKQKKENKPKIKSSTYTKSTASKKHINPYARKQSFFKTRSNGKNKKSLERIRPSITEATITGRKRQTLAKSTTDFMGCLGFGMEIGACCSYKEIKRFRLSSCLQNRHRFSIIQNRYRTRWLGSRTSRTEKNRQEKNEILGGIRVEDTTIQESGSGGQSKDGFVYNLQVSGHPSYYAEGILVHNCHKIKNNKAKRTKAVKVLAKGIPHVIAMSGTPILNRPFEIYNAVNLVNPLVLPEFWTFTKRYCNRHHDGFGWNYNGSSNEMELNEILTESVMIRRLKKDVEIQMPEKTWSYVPMEMDNWMEYYAAEQDFIQYLRDRKGKRIADKAEKAEHLVKTETLKQIAVRGKIKQCISWIEDFLEVEKKLVVFCIHRDIALELEQHFASRAVKVVGGMTSKQKQHAMDRFQTSDDIQLFIGNMKAAGESINLTASSNVVILELPWTPGELQQAEDRCHRLTQKNNVTVHFLLARDSIEEKIASLLDSKAETIKAVTDGVVLDEESMLTQLMNQYLKS
jgi:SWI/SNF-related matrix-associated actin-dependent regulator 1 of chromatin subfamily A